MANKIERAFVDLETTGLDPTSEVPLELGITLTNRWGGIIDEASWLIWDPSYYMDYVDEAIPLVLDMHNKSGLWKALETEETWLPSQVENKALEFMDGHDIRHRELPMSGNNVPFDRGFLRRWMPKLEANFHYRNIDISTLKELCRNLNPTVFSKAPVKEEKHRVIPDLIESITEYKFYVENFLWTE